MVAVAIVMRVRATGRGHFDSTFDVASVGPAIPQTRYTQPARVSNGKSAYFNFFWQLGIIPHGSSAVPAIELRFCDVS